MTYIFRNTEMNNEKASNFETKSLLYLIGQRSDSKDVVYVTFDCFNDVSGINKKTDKIWDIQSKNERTLNPKKIGKYFYTLFDNFTSIFDFEDFIFFCPELKLEYKIDPLKTTYNLDNIVDKTSKRIKKGLTEEIERVKGNSTSYALDIDSFLKKVLIVEDKSTNNEYIKAVTKFKNTNLKNDDFYSSLFNDLRDIQTAKKNSYIENSSISEIREVLNFRRYLTTKDIETLIISRIIGCEIFKYKSIPIYFSQVLDGMDIEDKKDLLQECNSNLSRAFFNKNSNKTFWDVCEKIVEYRTSITDNDVENIYLLLFVDYKFRISYITKETIIYLISIIIEGLDDN
ncbi:hypothetical protein H8R27_01780 [Flavobacterium sp. F-408]|uniref:DUF4297 domain-containing protein n=2 Tax=Flavobacterium bernardetii TaxID=2813823 RepID=A0ABR7IV03_9FLAO|nr:hypothetical protein [Flavobacterium bernardetii]